MTCTKCDLHKNRKNIVRGKGVLPAEVLFIGEAPGNSENIRGLPLAGKNGSILKLAIKATEKIIKRNPPKCYFTNAVCCPAIDEDGNKREPSGDEILACYNLLEETYLKANPERVIFLGDVSYKHLKKIFPGGKKVFAPGYINLKGGTEATEFRTLVRDLSEIFKGLENEI